MNNGKEIGSGYFSCYRIFFIQPTRTRLRIKGKKEKKSNPWL